MKKEVKEHREHFTRRKKMVAELLLWDSYLSFFLEILALNRDR